MPPTPAPLSRSRAQGADRASQRARSLARMQSAGEVRPGVPRFLHTGALAEARSQTTLAGNEATQEISAQAPWWREEARAHDLMPAEERTDAAQRPLGLRDEGLTGQAGAGNTPGAAWQGEFEPEGGADLDQVGELLDGSDETGRPEGRSGAGGEPDLEPDVEADHPDESTIAGSDLLDIESAGEELGEPGEDATAEEGDETEPEGARRDGGEIAEQGIDFEGRAAGSGGPRVSGEPELFGGGGDVDNGGGDVESAALIDEELVEHERWAGSFGEMGTAGSDERARFLLDQAGQGATAGAVSGAGMGFVMSTIGAVVGRVAGQRLATLAVSRGLSATPVPGLGAAIGGVMAVAGLAMRDWGATADTIGRLGEGEGYEGLANDLEAIAEVLDVATSVMDVLAGVLGAIAVGMWIGAVLSAGALSPLALSLSAIALGINAATTAIGLIINITVRPTVVALRALHTFESQGDPAQIEAEGQLLQGAASQITGAVTGHVAGRVGGRAGHGLGGRADRAMTRLQARRRGGTPTTSARSGAGPRIHAEVPEAPTRPGSPAEPVAAPARGTTGETPSAPRPAAPAQPVGPSPTAEARPSAAAAAAVRPAEAPQGAGSRRSRRVAPSEESFADAEFDTIVRDLRNSEFGYNLEAGRRRPLPELRTDTTRTRAGVDEAAHSAARRNPPPGRVPGSQIQHNTKTLDVTRDLPPGMAPLHPDVINENIMWLQSRTTLPATQLHVDPSGGGTRYWVDDIPRGRRGDAGMPGEQLDFFRPSPGGRDRDYGSEHRFMDRPASGQANDPNGFPGLIPRESQRIAAARRRAGLPPLDPRMLAIAAGEQARYILSGDPGTRRSGEVIDVAAAASSRPTPPAPAPPASPQLEIDFSASRPRPETPAAAGAASPVRPAPRYVDNTETGRTPNRAAAMAQYHDQVRHDPGRESAVYRGRDGTYYVMQGDSTGVDFPSSGGPFELVYHSHPTAADVAMQAVSVQPSQAAGDIEVLQSQHGAGPAGRRHSSELHFPVYDDAGNHIGYGATRFAYDPTHPLPLQVQTTLPDGRTSTQRYGSFDEFQGRTGVAAGGANPAAATAAADARLRADTEAARQRIDETADTLVGRPEALGGREGREAGRRTLEEGPAGEGESVAGPAYTASIAGLAPGESIDIPINPAYPEPPGTLAEIEVLMEQVSASQETQRELDGTEQTMTAQAADQRTHEEELGEAASVTDDLVEGRGAHDATVEGTAATNEEQQSTAGDAITALGQGAQEATALATLVGSLRTFQGLAHLFSYLPGDLGESAEGARDDAGRLITTLNRVSETERVQGSVEGGRDAMEADAQRISDVATTGADTDSALSAGEEGIAALTAANAASLAETESVASQARQERAAAQASETEAQATHDELLARLQTWAQEHCQAREDAIAAAAGRLTEAGYEVTEAP